MGYKSKVGILFADNSKISIFSGRNKNRHYLSVIKGHFHGLYLIPRGATVILEFL